MIVDLIILITCSIAITILGLLVLFRDPKKSNNRRFAFLSFALIFWTVANFLSDNSTTNILLYTRLTFFAGVLTAFALVTFLAKYPRSTALKNSVLIHLHLLMTVILLPVTLSSQFVSSVSISNTHGVIETGFLYGLFIVYIAFSILILAPMIIVNQYRRAVSRIERQQITMISWGIVVYSVLAVTSSVVLPLIFNDWSSSTFGPAFALILVGMVTYTIVKHGLFDIRLAAVRSLTYVLSLMVLAVIYYFIAYIVSVTLFQNEVSTAVSISPVNIMLALILAFIFQPIKNFFDKITNNIFYRDRYDTTEFYARLSEVLTTTTDLRSLLQRAANEIAATLKAEQAFFFIQYNHSHRVTTGTDHHKELPPKDVVDLNEYVAANGDAVIVAALLAEKHRVRRIMTSHKIAIMMPLVRHTTVIGYLALGEQKSSGYAKRDITVLNTISDELLIAIQNSLSVQEVKDINANLEQSIHAATAELRTSNARLKRLDATKDEFLSMASHQLRTPLTSVKGYLSMVLEEDLGKVPKAQKQVLQEAYISSERMVHLIHDFLNVSRLQTGKFMLEKEDQDIAKLIAEEVKSLERVAQSRDMKLAFTNTAGKRIMHIDSTKVRQVIMNFIDNSIYYSHPNTTIKISLSRARDHIVLKVTDTGIGVPKTEQAQLFNKFYRASNARKQRPDGTGVGLFLSKKVITAHGGDVIFESKEGKGSTFGFWLPFDVPLDKRAD